MLLVRTIQVSRNMPNVLMKMESLYIILSIKCFYLLGNKTNSVALSPRANYTY
jgi:hypothetical protein